MENKCLKESTNCWRETYVHSFRSEGSRAAIETRLTAGSWEAGRSRSSGNPRAALLSVTAVLAGRSHQSGLSSHPGLAWLASGSLQARAPFRSRRARVSLGSGNAGEAGTTGFTHGSHLSWGSDGSVCPPGPRHSWRAISPSLSPRSRGSNGTNRSHGSGRAVLALLSRRTAVTLGSVQSREASVAFRARDPGHSRQASLARLASWTRRPGLSVNSSLAFFTRQAGQTRLALQSRRSGGPGVSGVSLRSHEPLRSRGSSDTWRQLSGVTW